MKKTTRRHYLQIICYLIATILMVSPVVHATSAMVHMVDDAPEHSHHNHQSKIAASNIELSSSNQEKVADTEHSSCCQLVCSAATVSTICTGLLFNIDNSKDWLASENSSIKTSYPSRLDKPPRI